MSFDPASRVQDYLVFGEFGDVNPSITDSSTYTFLSPERMAELFEHEIEGCFLYSRHFNPTNKYLANALERMEDGEVGAGHGVRDGCDQHHADDAVWRWRRDRLRTQHLRRYLRAC
jgi:hypothetical protein